MNAYLFFFIALSFLLIHEMDAIRCREWKLFPVLSQLTDERGYIVFTALHIPLYILLLWGLFPGGAVINSALVAGLDIFCIIHVGLHLLFINHPENRFNNPFSWILILGAGLAGGLDLLV